MRVEQVRVGAARVVDLAAAAALLSSACTRLREQAAQHPVRPLTVQQPRPERHLPGHRPAGARVAPRLQGLACRGSQRGRARGRNLLAGEQREQLRDMAVRVLRRVQHRIFFLIEPFQQLAPTADTRTCQPVARGCQRVAEGRVGAQHIGRLHAVVEQVPDDLLVVADAVLGRPVFGRPAQRRDQPAIRELLQMVEPELAHLLHQRPGLAAQKSAVLRVGKVLPEVARVPSVGRLVPQIAHRAEGVGFGAHRPTAQRLARRREEALLGHRLLAVPGHDARPRLARMRERPGRPVGDGLPVRRQHALHETVQRPGQLGQIGRLGRPVVHLDIDVGVVVGIPRRRQAVVPQALQIGRQGIARAGDQQVAAELHVQRLQLGVVAIAGVGGDAGVGGQCAALGGAGAEIEGHAVEQRAVVLLVFGAQGVERLGGGGRDLRRHARQRVVAVELARRIGDIAGARAQNDRQRIAVAEAERLAVNTHRPAIVEHLNLAGVAHRIGQGAGGEQPLSRSRDARPVHVRQTQAARVARLFVRRESQHDHLRRMAGKRLTAVVHAAQGVAVHLPAMVELQLTRVARRCLLLVPRQLDEHIAKGLVRPHQLGIARPQGDVVELHPLPRQLAEQHRAQPAVADGQSLALPAFVRVRRGFGVAQREVGRSGADGQGGADQQQKRPHEEFVHTPTRSRPTITPRPCGARYTTPCSSGSAVIDSNRP